MALSLDGALPDQIRCADAIRRLMQRAAEEWAQAVNAEAVWQSRGLAVHDELGHLAPVLRIDVVPVDQPHDWRVQFGLHPQWPQKVALCRPLPVGDDVRSLSSPSHLLLFDRGARWAMTFWQRLLGRRDGIDLLPLLLHEMGHALGLAHGDGSIMRPEPCLTYVDRYAAAQAARKLREVAS